VGAPQKTPDKPLTPTQAWQPFTPRGIAAFSVATLSRLVAVQLAGAALIVIALLCALQVAWVPVIDDAIQQLPDAGSIRRGELNFGGESPKRLAGNSRFGVAVDLAGTREAGQVADVEATFEKSRVVLRGPFGAAWRRYDPNYVISFNRPELAPAWDAWRWPALALLAVGTVLALFAMWWALALIYSPLVKFIAFFLDRAVTWRGAWRVSGAALMPGAVLMMVALLLYGYGVINLLRFGLLYALHGVTGLVFVFTTPWFLPKFSTPLASNPFSMGASKQTNPFEKSDKP
jgi:hypothetical protein